MIFLDEVVSTNDWIKENIQKLDIDSAVLAKTQYGGKGRLGRNWDSSIVGNLYLSFLVRNAAWLQVPTHLSIIVPVAIRRTLTPYLSGKDIVKFKWPNDLVTAKGKFGGILIENIEGAFVVGIGINIVKAPQIRDVKTSCLSDFIETSQLLPENLASEFLVSFDKTRIEYLKFGFDKIKEEWLRFCSHLWNDVMLEGNERVIFIGLGPSGEAIVKEPETGNERSIFYGEIGVFLS